MMSNLIALTLVAFISISLIGFALDRPVLMSYVTSNSMNPTLEVGDMFFINPISKGDVGQIIVFKMNGHWTVHRVYAKVSGGYITKGDNNVATDQQNSFAKPVNESDIAGTVITLNGKPIRIPKIGIYIEEISRRVANLYLALTLLAVGSVLLTGNKKKNRRKRKLIIKYKTLYSSISAITIAVLILAIMSSWGQIGFSYASTLAGGQRDGWYLPNSEFEKTIEIKNNWIYPAVYVLDPIGTRLKLNKTSLTLAGRSLESVSMRVRVPSKTMVYSENIKIYAYPLLLPSNFIVSMASITPYLPLIAFSTEFALLFAIIYFATGSGNETVFVVRRRFL